MRLSESRSVYKWYDFMVILVCFLSSVQGSIKIIFLPFITFCSFFIPVCSGICFENSAMSLTTSCQIRSTINIFKISLLLYLCTSRYLSPSLRYISLAICTSKNYRPLYTRATSYAFLRSFAQIGTKIAPARH